MNNQTDPFSTIRSVRDVPLVYETFDGTPPSFIYKAQYFFEPAEFTDMTDPVGLFEQEIEAKNFFIDTEVREQSYLQKTGKYDGLPLARVQFYLSDRKHIYNR